MLLYACVLAVLSIVVLLYARLLCCFCAAAVDCVADLAGCNTGNGFSPWWLLPVAPAIRAEVLGYLLPDDDMVQQQQQQQQQQYGLFAVP